MQKFFTSNCKYFGAGQQFPHTAGTWEANRISAADPACTSLVPLPAAWTGGWHPHCTKCGGGVLTWEGSAASQGLSRHPSRNQSEISHLGWNDPMQLQGLEAACLKLQLCRKGGEGPGGPSFSLEGGHTLGKVGCCHAWRDSKPGRTQSWSNCGVCQTSSRGVGWVVSCHLDHLKLPFDSFLSYGCSQIVVIARPRSSRETKLLDGHLQWTDETNVICPFLLSPSPGTARS